MSQGGPPYKTDECSWETFKTIPKGDQDPVSWAWLEILFTRKRHS